jgi:pyruvate/2-oxoglutarate dehydrogenase complex dihydrolipoamide dehydrogenase (E3) component
MVWIRTDVIEYSQHVIIVATESRVEIPSDVHVDGGSVFTVRQILNGTAQVSGRVFVLEGGSAVCEVADYLAVISNDVTLIRRYASLINKMEVFQRHLLLDLNCLI